MLSQVKGRRIYVMLSNGFSVNISRKELTRLLKAMKSENEDLSKVLTTLYGKSIILFTFPAPTTP